MVKKTLQGGKNMKKEIGILAAFAVIAVLTAMSVSAVPVWTVDKYVSVTGDWVWDGGAWTLPTPQPVTATYGFQAYGLGHGVNYQESEVMGQAWKYNFNNMLTSDYNGAVHAFSDITTVNVPGDTPGVAFTSYAFGTMNSGAYTHSTVVISGEGFATIDHSASFNSAFTSQNFVCINDCTA
jgi:hypothetical protein